MHNEIKARASSQNLTHIRMELLVRVMIYFILHIKLGIILNILQSCSFPILSVKTTSHSQFATATQKLTRSVNYFSAYQDQCATYYVTTNFLPSSRRITKLFSKSCWKDLPRCTKKNHMAVLQWINILR